MNRSFTERGGVPRGIVELLWVCTGFDRIENQIFQAFIFFSCIRMLVLHGLVLDRRKPFLPNLGVLPSLPLAGKSFDRMIFQILGKVKTGRGGSKLGL